MNNLNVLLHTKISAHVKVLRCTYRWILCGYKKKH